MSVKKSKMTTKYVKKQSINELLPKSNTSMPLNAFNEILSLSVKRLYDALKQDGSVDNLETDYEFIKNYLRRIGIRNPDNFPIENIIRGILSKPTPPTPDDYRICRILLYKNIVERRMTNDYTENNY